MNNRIGFYGFFGGIAMALLLAKLSGCASPASANTEREPVRIEHIITSERTVEHIGTVTLTTEPGVTTLYYYN